MDFWVLRPTLCKKDWTFAGHRRDALVSRGRAADDARAQTRGEAARARVCRSCANDEARQNFAFLFFL